MKTTILVLILLLAGIVIADNTDIAIKEPTSVVGQPDYKLLYENQKEYNGNVISTINIALGIFTFACALVLGFNYYFNLQKYNQLKDKFLKLQEENNKQFTNSFVAEIEERFEKLQKNINGTVQSSLGSNDLRLQELERRLNHHERKIVDTSERLGVLDNVVDSHLRHPPPRPTRNRL